ncbi:MAG: hypothetical protein EA397_08540 [Deltaproteobacteria bacterium]|nr:MAG: hypothetical protein EA397_08540 [Deltaproteobacteria bacterium]
MLLLFLLTWLAAAEPPGRAVASTDRAEVRGTWTRGSEGWRLAQAAPGHMDVRLAAGPDWTDGTAQAALRLGARPHVTLLVRTTHPGELEALSGIGLTLRANRVQWERWDHGVSLPVAPAVSVAAGLAGRAVTVQIEAQDDRFDAKVLDRQGAVLAQAAVRDARWPSGGAAVRVQGDTSTAIGAIAVQAEPIDPKAPRAQGDPRAPMGQRRFVLVPPEHLAELSKDLRAADLGTWPYDDSGRRGLLLSVAQAERLRAGRVAHEVWPLVPFWALDADIRAAGREVPLDAGRPDLRASYKDPDMVRAVLEAWAAQAPDRVSLHSLGESHQGRGVYALRLSAHPDPDRAPAVLILGGIHGSELLATEYALHAAERLLYGPPEQVDPLLQGLDLWFVPLLNPDGNVITHQLTRFSGRKNGRPTAPERSFDPFGGVDLNRNFPVGWGRDEQASRSFVGASSYRGPEPASEPETQALMRLADARRFVAAISFHTQASMILVPYTLDGFPNPEPNVAQSIAQAISAATPTLPSGKDLRVRRQIYPVDGTEQDWLRFAHGTVAYNVEGSHHNPTSRALRHASIDALEPVVPTLLQRVLSGPRISGRVTDPHGVPIQAEITLSTETLRAGERWTSRPTDGRFDRLVTADGPVTITARAEGFSPATLAIDLQGVADVTILLEPAP